jgi:hypothetical protein
MVGGDTIDYRDLIRSWLQRWVSLDHAKGEEHRYSSDRASQCLPPADSARDRVRVCLATRLTHWRIAGRLYLV